MKLRDLLILVTFSAATVPSFVYAGAERNSVAPSSTLGRKIHVALGPLRVVTDDPQVQPIRPLVDEIAQTLGANVTTYEVLVTRYGVRTVTGTLAAMAGYDGVQFERVGTPDDPENPAGFYIVGIDEARAFLVGVAKSMDGVTIITVSTIEREVK